MNAGLIVLIVAVAVVVLALLVWLGAKRRRTATLRGKFGPEYERRIDEAGDKRQAEAELRDVAKRRKALDIRPLSDSARAMYGDQWRAVQMRFVDEPEEAVGEADTLVGKVMRERGYPVDDFDEQVDMVTVDHPEVATNYRAAHGLSLRNAQRLASTDDLRQALLHFRSLFDELLADSADRTDKSSARH